MGSIFVHSFVLILSAMSLVSQSAALAECTEGTVNCLVDPCSTVDCASGFTCVASYCGGCYGNCVAIECPLLMCPECANGNVIDSNNCRTCECNEKCGERKCKADEFCSSGDCCSNDVRTIRCSDPCANKTCPRNKTCEAYCNCSSRCV